MSASDLRAPRRLLLLFGALVAAANLVGWTMADWMRYGEWTTTGIERAVFVLCAVLALYIVLRLALLVTHQDTVKP
ncbi:MAG: hypothetical protein AAGI91_11785 [Bacteroidota bacterium]